MEETRVELPADDRGDAKDGCGLPREARNPAPDERPDLFGNAVERIPDRLVCLVEELVRPAEQDDLAQEERVPPAQVVEPG